MTLRRNFLMGSMIAAAGAATLRTAAAETVALPTADTSNLATDDGYWAAVRDLYDVDRSIANLENGYWGIMARPVLEVYLENTQRVNRQNSLYHRSAFGTDFENVRTRVAAAVGALPEEVALTRGATEALQVLITGYNKLQPGDAVLYCDLDYDSMQYAMAMLKDRRGVEVKTFSIPEPVTREAVLETYKEVLDQTPKAKLLLLTHLSHRTGLVMPTREITDMARERGVDTIVDAAHSWGQISFNATDLGADFVGFNLHKWIGAPVGMGFFYIKKGRLADIDIHMGDQDWPADDIRSRIHTGTLNFAAALSVPAALDLHEKIGAASKNTRLTYLRNQWVGPVRAMETYEILTPDDQSMHAGITSFRVKSKGTKDDNNALVAKLRDEFKVLTVCRAGVAAGQCIRVSPALYTTEAEVARLVEALAVISGA
ncbi:MULTISPECIES: aminotransferase class V-fold PLP-dependent enzyme [Mesorhizobium]|uniref:Selenocysteine lyase/cysteine desulfurase n=1 Tax=Rhizobium loti TaxID=381 RepID=A0A8E2WIY1_RHILI|nr:MULTISPECIES: aminotransferase class V-fold PLP-dependent enzyme [Mesorhizobium]PWJ93865.1 selenocysteine lyase/cysteine desulfurase [Mesorhizobium loti]QKC82224.1 aminotransferase class V-fold PLP-dependent enzyme [Mesorhizobium sp. NZP2077]QKD15698.1 aminotransferase class V-fold PLP-dependent enzyme [Mesorhizobium sp. NZP2077]